MHSVATLTPFAISINFPRKFRPPVSDRNSQVLLQVGCAATISARKIRSASAAHHQACTTAGPVDLQPPLDK